jgi:O-antigen/teichoic acid export membrane protein
MTEESNSFKKSNTVQALWVGLGSLSSFGLAIVSAAILSRYFEKDEYGTYRQIIYVYSSLLVIFTAGLPRVFGYFLPRYSLEEGRAIVWKISKLLLIAGFFFSISLFFGSNLISKLLNNPELSYGLKVFSPIPFFLLPTLGLGGVFASYKITIYTAIYNTLSRLIMLLFIVAPVIFFGGNYITAIYGWLIASIITFFVAFFFKSIPFKKVAKRNTELTNKEIFNYSLPLVVASLWGVAIKASDQFYISRYFGAEIFAEFSNGFIVIPFVSIITASASAVLMPVFSKIFHENIGKEELVKVWKSVLLKSTYAIYPIVIFCLFNADKIITIIYSDVYVNSIVYFQICMFLNFFNIIIFAPLIFAMGETRFYAYTHAFIAVLAWGGGLIIVSYFKSPVLIAVFSVGLSIIKVIIFFIFISRKLKLKLLELFDYKKTIKIIIHTLFIIITIEVVLRQFALDMNPIVNLLLQLLLYYILILSTGRYFGLNYLNLFKPLIDKGVNYFKKKLI